jgi:hypothetical protein
METESITKHASLGMLQFCGSMLVLAISLKIVGVDFEPMFDAYSRSIEAKFERESNQAEEAQQQTDDLRQELRITQSKMSDALNHIDKRLRRVETMAHAQKVEK